MAAPDYVTKVGNTFSASGVVTDTSSPSVPVNLVSAGIAISSAMISPDGSRTVNLTVDVADQSVSPGAYTLRVETGDFTPGVWRWDIRFRYATDSSSDATKTLNVLFNEQVTA